MKKKYKLLIVLLLLGTMFVATGVTYSVFSAKADLNTINEKIAKFVFDAEMLDNLELPLGDLTPGESKIYNFKVTNNHEDLTSNVTINYQITLKTFHFIPLVIELFKEDEEVPLMVCDEGYSRNSNNELVCNSSLQEMKYIDNKMDNYRLKVTFPKEYNGEEFAGLVDFIDLEISSFQKLD